MMDIKIYIDTEDDIRIIRRIKRDINKRNRTFASVIDQYYKTVRPMHIQFVEPTKRYADIRYEKGIIKNQFKTLKSKTSYNVINNFIKTLTGDL